MNEGKITQVIGAVLDIQYSKENLPNLYNAIVAWAEDDFRSVNGQIEYLLSECVRQRKKNGKYVSDEIDVPPELDI